MLVTLLTSNIDQSFLHLGEVQAWAEANGQIPEPATYAHMAAGLGGLALLRRRK
ncbi:MAG: PEP-CTERM sorting domain-containing protein [Acidobacteria bacterium]|nr:PEP-CTERM sorting domain-containing protein [Acidobacteriota bacterium]